ncbi:MAG: hypothetical protein QM785_15840 [Pyrinomonadaceae bacterium]
MKNTTRTLAIFIIMLAAATAAFSQFPKLPKLKDLVPKTTGPSATGTTATTPTVGGVTQSTSTTSATPASTEASILRRTMNVWPRRYLRYWKNPAAAEPVYDTWSWAPEISFSIYGPVASGSQVFVEWDTPDGKPWFTQRMRTPTLEPDYYDEVKDVEGISRDDMEKKAITTQSGLFPFRIKLKNAINGTEQLLFSGKYKMFPSVPNQAIPEFKGKKEFVIDEDWRIPMAWLWLNPVNNEKAPILNTQMWFKASESSDNFEAFLFYNGKQISNSKAGSADETMYNASDEKATRYSLRTFYFPTVRGWNKDTYNSFASSHFLDKNPGEYEIRVLRNGELSRSFAFTVGSDGKVVDNGVAKNNKVGGTRWIIPAKVLGTADGKVNLNAWQTDAFYGNTLTGFTPIQ